MILALALLILFAALALGVTALLIGVNRIETEAEP